jgi:uncharacterized membrane protein YtjA (UPF0391 family)
MINETQTQLMSQYFYDKFQIQRLLQVFFALLPFSGLDCNSAGVFAVFYFIFQILAIFSIFDKDLYKMLCLILLSKM